MTSFEPAWRRYAIWGSGALLLLPGVLIVALGMAFARPALLSHLATTVLPALVGETLLLMTFAVPLALLLGALPAWVCHHFEFPLRRTWEFLSLLPLALPAFVTAGVFQEAFPASAFWESRWALGVEIGAATAPYAFLFVRLALGRICAAFDETAQSLATGVTRRLLRVHLPLALPAVLAAGCLTAADLLGDYGAAARLGVRTLSLGLHDLWFGFADRNVALMLVALLMLAGGVLVALPVWALTRRSLQPGAQREGRLLPRVRLSGRNSLFASLSCLAFSLPGSLAPLAIVLQWLPAGLGRVRLGTLWSDAASSLLTAFLVLGCCLAMTAAFALLPRTPSGVHRSRGLAWLSLLNFATPPLALGVLAFVVSGDDSPMGPLLQPLLATRGGLVLAAAFRFLPFLLLPTMDALGRMPAALEEAAATLGSRQGLSLRKVRIPYLVPALKIGCSLVFLETLKEFTLSLLLQPFGYGALSIRVFAFADLHALKNGSPWVLVTLLIAARPLWALLNSLEDPARPTARRA